DSHDVLPFRSAVRRLLEGDRFVLIYRRQFVVLSCGTREGKLNEVTRKREIYLIVTKNKRIDITLDVTKTKRIIVLADKDPTACLVHKQPIPPSNHQVIHRISY